MIEGYLECKTVEGPSSTWERPKLPTDGPPMGVTSILIGQNIIKESWELELERCTWLVVWKKLELRSKKFLSCSLRSPYTVHDNFIFRLTPRYRGEVYPFHSGWRQRLDGILEDKTLYERVHSGQGQREFGAR